MTLRFDKLTGAGNDFVLVEGKGGAALAKRLCDRRSGIGADGLLVVSRRPRLKLSYFNADGSASFCGNGSRCAAWWMFKRGWTKGAESFAFTSSEGTLEAKILKDELVSIRMPGPKVRRLGMNIKALGRSFKAHWLDTGVPHGVVEVRGLAKFPVEAFGPAVRGHKAFGRAGVNADFVEYGPRGLSLRTFERGVEGETLACGTGVTAAALAAFLTGKARPPVSVTVRSGQKLRVHFRPTDKGFEDVWLEGPAKIVFSGETKI